MPYCKSCGAELSEDARFCSGCGTPTVAPDTIEAETHRTLKVTGKPRVVVTSAVPGSVEVKAGPEAEVTVDLDLRKPEDLDWSISQDGDDVTVACRMVDPVFGWPKYVFSGGPRAAILVTVPAEADLNLETSVCKVAVAGVRGALAVESSTGTVTMQDCEGTVSARNKVGSVNLESVNGTVSVRNATGSIRYTGALSKGESGFRTVTGSIELTLRGEPDLAVEASSRLGGVSFSPELMDARYERGQHRGRIGAGTGRLVAETQIGKITIRR